MFDIISLNNIISLKNMVHNIMNQQKDMQYKINNKTICPFVLHIRLNPTIDSNDKQLKRHNAVLNLKVILGYPIICTLDEHKRNNTKGGENTFK